MRRPNPRREQGFGLLAFVVITSIVAFSLVVGYSSVMTRAHAQQRNIAYGKWLSATMEQIATYYKTAAYDLDQAAVSAESAASQVTQAIQFSGMAGAQLVASDILGTAEGYPSRRYVVYFPVETDGDNPPDLDRFRLTGEFVSCIDTSRPCDTRRYSIFDSSDVHRALAAETQERLVRIAHRAQSYFKARLLQDPERNISVNYFLRPNGACAAQEMDLDCHPTYQPLAEFISPTSIVPGRTALVLGLAPSELVSAWGTPIEVSNEQDAETDLPPFTMVFRARVPGGGYLVVRAVQPL